MNEPHIPGIEGKEMTAIPEMPLKIAVEQAILERDRIGGYDPQRIAQEGNTTPHAVVRLAREVQRLQTGHGCLKAGPGRGDCLSFVGLPLTLKHPDTIDHYGRPHQWCQVCWIAEKERRITETVKKITIEFDQSERENKAYNKVFNGLRSKAQESAADLVNWTQTERDKELGKG